MPLPTYIFAKLRHPRKRRTATPPPGPVTVVAVQFVDTFHVYWKFSSRVLGFDIANGFLVGGLIPGGLDITPEGWMLISYDSTVAIGDVWEVTEDVAVTFESGMELEIPESGTVIS